MTGSVIKRGVGSVLKGKNLILKRGKSGKNVIKRVKIGKNGIKRVIAPSNVVTKGIPQRFNLELGKRSAKVRSREWPNFTFCYIVVTFLTLASFF